MAERLATIAKELGVPFIFKASYDKANRSSVSSFRGPQLEEGLRILADIKKRTGLPILTDVHDISQVGPAGGSLRYPANTRVPLPPDGSVVSRRPHRPVVNVKKGPISLALGNRQRRRENRQHRKRKNHSHRTRHFIRLSKSGGRHAFVPHHAKIRLSDGFRRDSFRAIARRSREVQRRPARIHRATGPRRHRAGH